jgi:tRNA modification GTPase
MSYPLDDTIVAVSSPPGGAARGILRLSGPDVFACLDHVFRPSGKHERLPRSAVTVAVDGALQVSGINSPIPCDLYLWPDGRSYTGQPAAEIHTLGCQPLLESIVGELAAGGARPAQPGEFTLRAFLAGRLDLTQAEAVLGVIDAADPRQLDVALAQLAGGLATPLNVLGNSLLELLAHLEAGFDFADEDLPFINREQLDDQLADAAQIVDRLARQMTSRTESTSLSRVVLVGRPNTGKSSLFNALATRAGALVDNRPGTTRDYVTAELDLDGVKCLLVDTAGIDPAPESAGDGPGVAAQSAAVEQAWQADVEILCLDSTRPPDDWEEAQLGHAGRVLVLTKIDIGTQSEPSGSAVSTSSVTGHGIDALRTRLCRAILAGAAAADNVVQGTAVRCRQSLELASESLDRARKLVQDASEDDLVGEELVAAEVRLALDEIGQVVGTVYTDDVLDRVFSRFCVGK